MTNTRIVAENIKFLIADVEYACAVNMVELTLGDAPGDVQTFCEQRVGGEWGSIARGCYPPVMLLLFIAFFGLTLELLQLS